MKPKKRIKSLLFSGRSLTAAISCFVIAVVLLSQSIAALNQHERPALFTPEPSSRAYADTNTVNMSTQSNDDGITFTSKLYSTANKMTISPNSFEAWVYLPSTHAASVRGGVVVGNYGAETSSVCMEVYTNYNPRLYWNDNGNVSNYIFNEVTVPLGEWFHLATVRDEAAAEVYCYLNGALAQTLPLAGSKLFALDSPIGVGGDMRSGNTRFFRGSIREAAVFYDTRTSTEIAADYVSINHNDTDLFGHWMFNDSSSSGMDLSGQNNNVLGFSSPETKPEGGQEFSMENSFVTSKPLGVTPNTFEAVIYLPTNITTFDRAGVIFGNYGDVGPVASIEVHSDFTPRIYWARSSTAITDVRFENATLPTGEWVHLAIVNEGGGKVSCYVNGELKQTKSAALASIICTTPHAVGSDLRSGSSAYFKGYIKRLAVYSDKRTSAQIAELHNNNINVSDNNLIALWDFSSYSGQGNLSDLSPAGNTLIYTNKWFKAEPTNPATYDYTFAVVGDTQVIAEKYPDKLSVMYQWIADNVVSNKISFVMGLGDMTNSNTDAEWQVLRSAMTKLDGVVPYSFINGNHDYSTNKNPVNLNRYFPYSTYSTTDWFGGVYEDGTMDNAFYLFEAGGNDYLVLGLEYGPTDAVLEWAGGVIEAHPEHNVIITTHSYLFRDGTTLDAGDVVPPTKKFPDANNGDGMWDKLASKHENVVMVISGHHPCDEIIVSTQTGMNGNIVTQILCDPQYVDSASGPTGLVLLLHFSDGGKTVTTEYYSTVRQEYFLEINQTTFNVDVLGMNNQETQPDETTESTNTTGDNKEETSDDTEETSDNTEETSDNEGCRSSVFIPPVLTLVLIASALIIYKPRKQEHHIH